MTRTEPGRSHPDTLKLVRRQAVQLTGNGIVECRPPDSGTSSPLIIQPAVDGVDLAAWAAAKLEVVNERLLQAGAILFRNFDLQAVDGFEDFIRAVSGPLLEYREQSSPRTRVSGSIYTSTEYPANQSIFLHNENSYAHTWPLKICFFCVTPAQQGGETPIADCRRILERIPLEVQRRFERRNIMYVRNFNPGLGLEWRQAFQGGDRHQVESWCRQAGYSPEWKGPDHLRTRRVSPAIRVHPRTGEKVWFNHATFFHVSTLDPPTRNALLAQLPEEDLPHNTYYGDGSPIEPWVLDELREAYRREAVPHPWRAGDVLMLDNMLMAHGRSPFVGARRVLVGMAEPCSS